MLPFPMLYIDSKINKAMDRDTSMLAYDQRCNGYVAMTPTMTQFIKKLKRQPERLSRKFTETSLGNSVSDFTEKNFNVINIRTSGGVGLRFTINHEGKEYVDIYWVR